MTEIAKAASVVLTAGPGSPELFIVRRARSLRFFGGFLAFPGGRVAPTDQEPACATDSERCRRIAAARELFEETGILLARRADGSFPPSDTTLDHWRRELLAERACFDELLRALQLTLHDRDLQPIGSITTPPFASRRFDTQFFLAHVPAEQQAVIWPGELDEGWWTTADAVLTEWERGGCLVSPPTVACLEAIRGRPVDDAPARLRPLFDAVATGAMHPIYFAPDVRLLPLRTQGLPPASYTNAYLVGAGPAYLLDPGPVEPEEQAQLFTVLDAFQADGPRLSAIVLTHQHPDHIGAAELCARRYSVPIWAHPATARLLEGRVRVDRFIEEGATLDLGRAADGASWHLEALHTPGHASGHLAFYEDHYQLLFAGDLVSTVSSVVIAPPDGDLAVYLDSLRRLRGYLCRLLLPGHGNVSARPQETIDDCLAHRAKREKMLLAALGPTPRSISELATEMYKGLPNGMMRFAEMQVQAGLQKLQQEGRAEPTTPDRTAWRLSAAEATPG